MKILVTGSAGFVGAYLCKYLREGGAHVVEADLPEWNIKDGGRLTELLERCQPEEVYHLAAQSSAVDSWGNPRETWEINLLGTVSMLEAVRSIVSSARILVVSSASVYDGMANGGRIHESCPFNPTTPYAASKAAAEAAVRSYVQGFGVNAVIARPFNVIGRGQRPTFVVPALCQRIAHARMCGHDEIRIGNTASVRDFLDVGDAVRALSAIMKSGRTGAAYNICSGSGISIGEIARQLIIMSGRDLRLVRDMSLQRDGDASIIIGDCSSVVSETGWTRKVSFDSTLQGIFDEWQNSY